MELFFPYGESELDDLRKAAPELAPLFDRYGFIRRPMNPDLFGALSESIVGQQISTKAQQTILGRLAERLGAVTPERILSVPPETVTACGVSLRKTDYLRGAAEAVSTGMTKTFLETLDDNGIISHLTRLKGVGIRTAEMMLIFCFGRPNVLSFGDFGIRTALFGDVDGTAVLDGSQHANAADLFGGNGQRVGIKHREIGPFSRLDGSFGSLLSDLNGGRQRHRFEGFRR